MAGIYLHIPFCKRACNYCDFYFTVNHRNVEAFVQAIAEEARLRSRELGHQTVETIYFGGGTPSLLRYEHFQLIFKSLYENYQISEHAEMTIEANPDDLNRDKLMVIRNVGFNRLSIGVQSFVDEHLIWMNRAHQSHEAIICIQQAQDLGIHNISIDLIYGFPMLCKSDWMNNLEIVNALGVPHLSCYSLTVEDGTKLATDIKKRKTLPPNEEESAEQLQILMDFAQAHEFEHYEISNFSKPGFHSRHNSSYWEYLPYLGLGPSAHSFTHGIRKHNIRNLKKYIENSSSHLLSFVEEKLSLTQQYNEFIITTLRKRSGLQIAEIEERFGASYRNYFSKALHSPQLDGLLEISPNNQVALSRRGIMLADYVMLQLIRKVE